MSSPAAISCAGSWLEPSKDSKMAFLEIDRVIKRFGALEVLKGIDLSVEKGGFLVLLGPSGCGKSTLLSMIAGLDTISEGEVRIDGRRMNDLRSSQRDIAMVRALVRDPKLFLFDEPLSNLDAKLRVDMRIDILRLHATTGTTIVYVTH